MAAQDPIEFDLERIDQLIAQEEATLEPKHRASIEYRAIADRYVAGGVASSWQDSPPHAIFIDRGERNRIYDIDGNEYLDFHLGYGAMVVGHAHPKVVEAIEHQARRGTHFAQPTKDLDVIGENLVDRFKLPLWRFANSGTEATLEAARLMRANTGRDMLIKIEGSYHGHHDSLMFSVAPDRADHGPARASEHRAAGPRDPAGVRRARPGRAVQRPRRGATGVRGEPRPDRRHDRRAGDDELRRDPPGAGLPPGAEGSLPRVRRVPRVRRGEDRRHARVRRRHGALRRRARRDLPGEGDRRRHAVRRDRRDPRALPAGDRGRVRHGRDVQRQPAHDGGQPRRPSPRSSSPRPTSSSSGSTRR